MENLKFKIISIGIGISLSLFLGEMIARVYFFGGDAFSFSKTNSFGILDNSGLIKYSNIDSLKYELIPNLNTKYKLVDFNTNAEGFRDKKHTSNHQTTKIAILGDSFTMGTGVKENEMYTYQTELILNKLDTQNSYEIFNFGVSGYSLANYLTLLNEKALTHKPDIVIIGFCASNDQYKIGDDFNLNDFTIKPKKNVFWDSYLKKIIHVKLFNKKADKVTYTKKQLNHVDSQFNELQQKLKQNSIKGIIFYMDLIYDSIRVKYIKNLAERHDLLFVDVSKQMQNKNLKKYILNELDPHPNGKANLIFAKTLTSSILAHKTLLLQNNE